MIARPDCFSSQRARGERTTVHQPQPDNPSSQSIRSLNSIRELGRYRSLLRLKALSASYRYPSKMDASDLVQQTLMEAYQKLDQFKGRSEPEMVNWLNRILSNNINDAVRALRSKKRDVGRERRFSQQTGSDGTGVMDEGWLPGEQTSPSLLAVREEEAHELKLAIARLPDPQKQAITLHHLHGNSLAEVAARMGRSQSAVAGLLYRGLKTLREKLG